MRKRTSFEINNISQYILINNYPFDIEKVFNCMAVIKKKMKGKKTSWGNQGEKSFSTDPMTSFWHKKGGNNIFKGIIL